MIVVFIFTEKWTSTFTRSFHAPRSVLLMWYLVAPPITLTLKGKSSPKCLLLWEGRPVGLLPILACTTFSHEPDS